MIFCHFKIPFGFVQFSYLPRPVACPNGRTFAGSPTRLFPRATPTHNHTEITLGQDTGVGGDKPRCFQSVVRGCQRVIVMMRTLRLRGELTNAGQRSSASLKARHGAPSIHRLFISNSHPCLNSKQARDHQQPTLRPSS
jgi:hypothetical protein